MLDDGASTFSCETQDQGFCEDGFEPDTEIYKYRCSNCIRLMDNEGVHKRRTRLTQTVPSSVVKLLRFCCTSCQDWAYFKLGLSKRNPVTHCRCYNYAVINDTRFKYGVKIIGDEAYVQELVPTLWELFKPMQIPQQQERVNSRSPRSSTTNRRGRPLMT